VKYHLHINQAKAIELGIKNINQAHVFDLLTSASSWATPIEIDNTFYYWVSRQSICKELKLLDIKSDTAYRHLKFLADIKLIDYQKQGLKDCIRLTRLGKSYIGNESEQTRNEIRTNSEINPIYPTTKHPTTNISKHKKDQIDNFVPNQASMKRLKLVDGCESLNPGELELLIADFKDRMIERKSEWKDIQSQFRAYVSNGWVKPKKLKKGTVDSKSTIEKQLLAMKIKQQQGRLE
tara:strand:+ start:110 stop:817 length:708 start_codon:yes stop_codon:yes gene_type:complete